MVKSWATDLVINKTYAGLKVQVAIPRHLASPWEEPYRLAIPEEEARGIDGYLGEMPVPIKPTTYEGKQRLPASIGGRVDLLREGKRGR